MRRKRTRLTRGYVNAILQQFAGGNSRTQIAHNTGIHYRTVCLVIQGRHGRYASPIRRKRVQQPPVTVTTTPKQRQTYPNRTIVTQETNYREKYFALLEKYVALIDSKLG